MKRTKEQIEANRQKALRIKAAKAQGKAQAARDNQRTEPAAQTAAAPLGPVTNTVAAPSRAARPTPPAAPTAPALPPSLPEAELFSANTLVNQGRDMDYQDFMHSPAWQPDHFLPNVLKLKLHQEVEILKGTLEGKRCVVSHLTKWGISLGVTDPSTGEEHTIPRYVFEANNFCPWRRRQFPVRPVD